MVKVILVDKGCNLKCSDVKDFNKDTLLKNVIFEKMMIFLKDQLGR